MKYDHWLSVNVMIVCMFLIAPIGVMALPADDGERPVLMRTGGPVMPIADFDWPALGNNETGQGATFSPGPKDNSELWTNTTTGAIYASPIVVDDKVIIGDVENWVYAFDALSGVLLWKNRTQSTSGQYGVSCTAGYGDDTVVVLSNNNDRYYAFNATTGEPLWNTTTSYNGAYGGGSITVTGGKVYAGAPNSKLVVLDLDDGSELWTYSLDIASDRGVLSKPLVANGMVLFGGTGITGKDTQIYCVNTTTHNLVWKYDTGDPIYSSPTLVGDRVVFGTGTVYNDGAHSVYVMDLYGFTDANQNDGWTNESVTGGSNGDVVWRWDSPRTGEFVSSPTYWNDTILIGSIDHRLYSLNFTTGTMNWEFNTGNWVTSSPAVADGHVFFGSLDSKLYSLYFENGTEDWNYDGSNEIWSSPAIANGVAYISNTGGNLIAVGEYVSVSPRVQSVNPANGATDVPKGTNVRATFTKDMDAASITTSSFTLEDSGSVAVPGIVSYTGGTKTATFDPDADLVPMETYTATLTVAMTDLSAIPLPEGYTWSFTVGNAVPVLSDHGVSPVEGSEAVNFTYRVTYTDADDQAPSSIKLFIDGSAPGQDMVINASASGTLNDGVFTNGEEYVYTTMLTVGTHNFTIEASDGMDDTATPVVDAPNVFSIVNEPPLISTIPVQTAMEDVPRTVDLGDFISDPDNTKDELSLKDVGPQNTTAVTATDFNVTLTYPEGVLEDIVSFIISDGENEVMGSFRVVVTPVNDPFTFDAIPEQTVTENVTQTYNISGLIIDIDTVLEDMTVTTDDTHVTAALTVLSINFPGPARTEVVEITVSDGDNSASQNMSVIVLDRPENNTPPTVSTLPDQEVDPSVALTFDIGPFLSDDGPVPALTVTTDSSYITVSGSVLTLLYPSGFLKETVTVTVSDGELDVTAIFNVTEKLPSPPVNTAPLIMAKDIIPGSGYTTETEISFELDIKDVDGDPLIVEIIVDGTAHAMTQSGGSVVTTAYYSYDGGKFSEGNHTVTFRADDGVGATNSVVTDTGFTFTVVKKAGGGGEDTDLMAGMMLPLLLIVIVIVIVVAVAVFMMKRKKPEPVQPTLAQEQVLVPELAYPQEQPPQEVRPQVPASGAVQQPMPLQEHPPQQ